ncbi:hypothetical protein HY480_00385 [Candidatus Uhrbacteria bacterium]|nr:hypothetical protein [Candidatus Uhrbacteria bacterium]
MGNVLREQWVAWRQDQDKQWLLDLEVTAESRRTVRVFITPDTECPSPLPDGGVEVTV